jgi:hypothetical protein
MFQVKLVKETLFALIGITSLIAGGCSEEAGPQRARAAAAQSHLLGNSQNPTQVGTTPNGGTTTDNTKSANNGNNQSSTTGNDQISDSSDASQSTDDKTADADSNTAPGSNGKGTPPPDTDDEEGDGNCRWFDPANVNFAEEIPGAPAGLMIPINKYMSNGRFESGNFLFTIAVYHNGDDGQIGSNVSLEPFRKAKKSEYVAIIMEANSSSCYALASLKKAEGRDHNGCFAMSTKIRMADGKDRPIALLKKGDRVLNPMTGKSVPVIRVIEGPEIRPMIEVGYKTASVKVTEKHPFMTLTGLKAAKDLKDKELILDADGKFYPINKLKTLPIDSKQLVRNITLGDMSTDPIAHMVLADGVVTGDLFLQNSLEKAMMSTVSVSK